MTEQNNEMPLGKKNYILIAVGVAFIFIGFLLMSTEKFVDSAEFSLSLYVCPFLIVGGFAEIIYAILAKSDKS
jgi:uncharacterized membrane protein HdeD (DUF308 family)